METISLAALTQCIEQAFQSQGVAPDAARRTAEALVLAEADGIHSHGVIRAPAYLAQLASAKVDGQAEPTMDWVADAHLAVNAREGFAFPAMTQGIDEALQRLGDAGVILLTIARSHHAGVLGHPVERLARRGALAMGFSNTPAAIAPWGGAKPLFGTNPMAFAAPRGDRQDPLVIDLSVSRVARGNLLVARDRGEAIPEDWAFDQQGRATTDPRRGLAGSMRPMADAKGASLALMIEILTAALTGSHFGYQASSFLDDQGDAPQVAQTFVIVAADSFVAQRVDQLLSLMVAEPGVRVPGERRFRNRRKAEAEGVVVSESLLQELAHWSAG